MNLAVSGWNGAGTSSLSLILAKTFNLKLIQATQTFRFLGEKLNYQDQGEGRIDADEFLEDYWGPIMDDYTDSLLTTSDNIILESDTAALRIGKIKNLFSVFLYADSQTRLKRLDIDNRPKDADLLAQRDAMLREKYQKISGVDWMNVQALKTKYNLVLDNSHLNISPELFAVYKGLYKSKLISRSDYERYENFAQDEEINFWEKGKDWYLDYIKDKNDYTEPQVLIKAIREKYKDKIQDFPSQLKSVIFDV